MAVDTLLPPCGGLGTELRSSVLVADAFTLEAIFPVTFQKSYTQLVKGGILHEVVPRFH